jgi:hypothetical protein
MNPRTTALLLSLALLAGPAAVAANEPATGPLDANYRVTLKIGDAESQSGFRERIYRTVARPGEPTELMMGWRTPIPSKRQEVTAGGEIPVTAYTYQNVGVTGHYELNLAGDKVLLRLQIEVSGAKEVVEQAGAPPTIGTFQQQLVVLLSNGKPLRIAEVPDHEGGSLFLEVTAEKLD